MWELLTWDVPWGRKPWQVGAPPLLPARSRAAQPPALLAH